MSCSTARRRLLAPLAVSGTVFLGLGGVAHVAGPRSEAGSSDPGAAPTSTPSAGRGQDTGAPDHVLVGRWRVEYDEDWFTGSVVYDLREEEGGINGYLIEIVDEKGQSLPDNTLILELRRWDGTRGEGRYHMEYEGERYEAECELELESESRLRVRYSIYGYRGDETWMRIEG